MGGDSKKEEETKIIEDTASAAEPAAKKKRTAERQITKDDPTEDGDDEQPADLNAPFRKASDDVLAKRKILKVKRPTAKPGTTGAASSNPFASTSLTTSADSKTTNGSAKVFGSGSAFSGFKGFGSSSTGFGSSTNGFASSTSTGFGATATLTTGGFGATASKSSEEDTKPKTPSLFGGAAASGFSFGFNSSTSGGDAANSAAVSLPENVELTTGEENETKMVEIRCKSFKWVVEQKQKKTNESPKTESNPSVKPSSNFENKNHDSDKKTPEKDSSNTGSEQHRWQELGVGPLKILRSREIPDKFRLVQRRESTPNGPAHKVILNVPLWKEATYKMTSEKHLSVTTVGASGSGETYALKFKEAIQAADFSERLEEACLQAKSCFA